MYCMCVCVCMYTKNGWYIVLLAGGLCSQILDTYPISFQVLSEYYLDNIQNIQVIFQVKSRDILGYPSIFSTKIIMRITVTKGILCTNCDL